MCSILISKEMLQNLLYSNKKKNHIVFFVFHFHLCAGLCHHSFISEKVKILWNLILSVNHLVWRCDYMYICSCYHLIFIFRSHRFRNVQVEVLYQRYFLRMNQNNMVSLLGLLICISIMLIVINHLFYSTTQNSIIQMVTLGAFTVMYILLVILMMRCFLNEVYLIIFSYSKF